jgi:hypothetical protein
MVQKLKYKVCIIPYKDCPIYMKDLQSSEDEINSILYTGKLNKKNSSENVRLY